MGYWKKCLSANKTRNMAEDRAKIANKGLYKVVHELSIAAKIRDFEWPLSEIQEGGTPKHYTHRKLIHNTIQYAFNTSQSDPYDK